MISEQNLDIWAERYINNQLSPAELEILHQTLSESDFLNNKWQEAIDFLNLLERKAKQDAMRKKLNSVASNINNNVQAKIETEKASNPHLILPFINKKNIFKIAGIAATLVICTSLLTLWFSNGNNEDNGVQYTLLRREIENIKHSQSKIFDSLNAHTASNRQMPIYGGTGFALTNDGYVATNYHVVKDAYDIYIQTNNDNAYKAYLVAFEPNTDVAILKIENKKFKFSKMPIPYHLATKVSKLGQKVFTLGYPQDNLVYNQGYISCETGFDNDSTSYQLEMVANPGQSGAPVLDKYGNIIALVTGKQSNTSGTTYAVQTQALLQLIHSLPSNTQKEIILLKRNSIRNIATVAQVKRIKPFICSVKVN